MEAELELLRDDVVMRVIPVRDAALALGRDLGNGVVLEDEHVSGHHAVVTRGPDGLTVRDLGSTNGTFVNGAPVVGAARLRHGDELRLGPALALRVRLPGAEPGGVLLVRDLAAGTVHLLEDDRFRIGSAADAHVRLPDGPARAATLVVHPDGEVWLEDRVLAPGDGFEVAGCAFRLECLAVDATRVPTARPAARTRYPYTLRATLGGAALVTDREGRACTVDAEHRVALLWLLGRRLRDDRAARVVPALAGWCHDEELLVGIWGRDAWEGAASRWSVLLHRVRRDLEGAGLDPLCVEKRRGATRLVVDEVELG